MSSSTSVPGSSEPPLVVDAERLPPERRECLYGRGLFWLWLVLLAGPLVWALDLQIAYLLVYRACHTRNPAPLYIETVVALAAVVAAAWTARRMLNWYPGADLEGGQADDRSRLLVVIAIGLNVLFFTVLAAAAVPRFTLDPCL
jgi:hypothetical protein